MFHLAMEYMELAGCRIQIIMRPLFTAKLLPILGQYKSYCTKGWIGELGDGSMHQAPVNVNRNNPHLDATLSNRLYLHQQWLGTKVY
jgi:hypothetical protein